MLHCIVIVGVALLPALAGRALAQRSTPAASQLEEMADSLKAALHTGDFQTARRITLQISNEISAQLAARRPPPEKELAEFERKLTSATGSDRVFLLSRAARMALDLQQTDKSAKYGVEILQLAESTTDWTRFVALHQGHTAIGRVELRKGNRAQSITHLLASAQLSPEPTLASFGPSAILAKELLELGERDAVLRYLEQCRRFWSHGASRLDNWIAAIERGEMPAFGPNLAF